MKFMEKIFYYMLMLLFATACNDDYNNSIPAVKDGQILLNLVIPKEAKLEISTGKFLRAGEATPESLVVLFFNRQDKKLFNISEVAKSDIRWNNETSATFSIATPTNQDGSVPNDIVFDICAYMYLTDTQISYMKTQKATEAGITEDQVRNYLVQTREIDKMPITSFSASLYNKQLAGLSAETFLFYRNVAKIEVKFEACEGCYPAELQNLGDISSITNIYIKNAPMQGYLNLREEKETPDTDPYFPFDAYEVDGNPSTDTDQLLPLVKDIDNSSFYTYTYEFFPAPSADRYILLQIGSYWYKIDFRSNNNIANNLVNIIRNHIYLIKILKITGAGYKDAEEAAKYPASNIVYTIEDKVEEIDSMVTNGQYELAVTDTLYLDAQGNHINQNAIIRLTSIKDKLPDESFLKPTLKVDGGDIVFKALSPSIVFPSTTGTTPYYMDYREYKYSLSAEPISSGNKVSYMTISAGNLERKVVVIQQYNGRNVDEYDKVGELQISFNGQEGTYTDYYTWLYANVDGIYSHQMDDRRDDGIHYLSITENNPLTQNNMQLYYRIFFDGPLPTIRDDSWSSNVAFINVTKFDPKGQGGLIQFYLQNDQLLPGSATLHIRLYNSVTGEPVYIKDIKAYKTGFFAEREKGLGMNDKYFVNNRMTNKLSSKPYIYYEIIKILQSDNIFEGNDYFLDRNVGATSNKAYLADGTLNPDAIGWHLKYAISGEDRGLFETPNYCNPRFPGKTRHPREVNGNSAWQELTKLKDCLEMVPKVNPFGKIIYLPKFIKTKIYTEITSTLYLPMAGYYDENGIFHEGTANYWSLTEISNRGFVDDQCIINTLDITGSTKSIKQSKVVVNGNYVGMPIRCRYNQ